jgi:hypothetical protein
MKTTKIKQAIETLKQAGVKIEKSGLGWVLKLAKNI